MSKEGKGWITFSGVMLIVAGLLNLVDGLWALDASDSPAVTDEVEDLLWYSDSLTLWGWVYTIVGAVMIVIGIGVFSRNQLARWIGIGIASVSMATNMMWVFVYPIPALIHFLVATAILYALTVYGGDELELQPSDPRSDPTDADRVVFSG